MSETKLIDIKELKFDEHNFNRHNDEGMSLLEKSIKENGLGRSILLDKDNNIVGGNGVTEKAIELGKTKVRIIETDGTELIAVKRTDLTLDSEQGRKMALADNSVAHANLEWNKEELQKAQDEWGLVPDEWGVELPDFGLPDEQAVETVEEDNFEIEDNIDTKVKAGEVWQLGEHRLMCGDSTDADAVAKLMNGERADIAFTSPPYNLMGGFNTHPDQADGYLGGENAYNEYSDDRSDEDYAQFLSDVLDNCLAHSDDTFFNIGYTKGALIGTALFLGRKAKNFCGAISWVKSGCYMPFFPIQHGMLGNITEPVYIFSKESGRKLHHPQWKQGETSYNIVETKNAAGNEYSKEHSATFPVEFAGEFISRFSEKSVLDLFGGTGTTMIAAEQLGRKCFMMEIDPHYCTVIIARWEKLTGQKAVKLNP